jgi:cytochrome c
MHKLCKTALTLALILGIATLAWGESATKEEVIAQCHNAGKLVQEKGIDAAIAAIGDKAGPFVWKDTYVFLMDLDGKMLAHPIKPELTQRSDLLQVADTDGKPLFMEFVKLANTSGKGWVDYMWPKPDEDKPVGKTSYIYRVPGTQYLVGAGIYK